MNKPAPIKRNKNLAPLSRDHHEGLLIVWKIQQQIKNAAQVEEIIDYILQSYAGHLQPHFAAEEKWLFSKGANTDTLCRQALEEHAAINQLIAIFKSKKMSGYKLVQQFAALLKEHIRFEERVLFPHLEKILSEKELEEAGKKLEGDHCKKAN